MYSYIGYIRILLCIGANSLILSWILDLGVLDLGSWILESWSVQFMDTLLYGSRYKQNVPNFQILIF